MQLRLANYFINYIFLKSLLGYTYFELILVPYFISNIILEQELRIIIENEAISSVKDMRSKNYQCVFKTKKLDLFSTFISIFSMFQELYFILDPNLDFLGKQYKETDGGKNVNCLGLVSLNFDLNIILKQNSKENMPVLPKFLYSKKI